MATTPPPPAPQPLTRVSLQVDNMHARLYKEMGLTSGQRQRMAEYWIQWERRRSELDALVATAREHLQQLPASVDLPPEFLSRLKCLAAPAAEAAGASAVVPVATPCGGHVDLSACEPVFLGQHPDAMAAAEGALQVLWRMHLRDRDMYLVNLDAQMPGVFISAKQAMRMWSEYMMEDVAPADFLSLCQLAATQQYRQDLFRRW